jgi:hypothetical protein
MEQRYKPVYVGLIKYRTGLYQHPVLERIRRRVERLEKTRMDQCRPCMRHCDPTVVFKKLDEPFKTWRRLLLIDVGLIRYRTGLYQHSMLERIRCRVEQLEKMQMDQCRPWRRHCDPTVVLKNWTNRLKVGGDTLFRTAVLNFEKIMA